MKKLLALLLLCIIATPQFARAEDTKPLQLAVFNPVQLVPEDESIKGARFSLFYALNKNVTGLSLVWLGVNGATGDVKGIELGLGNWVEGSAYGLQFGLVNHAGKRCVGLQYGAVNIVGGDFTGVQWGFVNRTEKSFKGFVWPLISIAKYSWPRYKYIRHYLQTIHLIIENPGIERTNTRTCNIKNTQGIIFSI